MCQHIKIAILGIGGVGGFVAAPLIHYAKNNPDISIILICRGETKKTIKRDGLILESKNQQRSYRADIVSDNPKEIGILDILILTTKSYSLSEIIGHYQSCITPKTTIIPLQNMVNATDIIQKHLPIPCTILEGVIYVASNIVTPGHIKHLGGPGKIVLGVDNDHDYTDVIDLLSSGGLDITFRKDIKTALWQKYLFVASVGAITSGYGITFGTISKDQTLKRLLHSLMKEIQQLANSLQIPLTDEMVADSLNMLDQFPPETKTSLQLDIERHKPETEKPFLIDHIIHKSIEMKGSCPIFQKLNRLIEKRIKII